MMNTTLLLNNFWAQVADNDWLEGTAIRVHCVIGLIYINLLKDKTTKPNNEDFIEGSTEVQMV